MKNLVHTVIMGILLLFSIYLYVIAEAPLQRVVVREEPLIDNQTEEQKALEYLNYLRVNSGLIPLRENSHLKLAAKNHANYLIQNSLIGHSEDRNNIGFTGKFGSNRAIFAGYKTSMVIENISNNNFSAKESIDGLMSAIYHRFGFLDFNIDEIGIGISQNINNRYESAFVYDMGSFNLENLCKKEVNNQNFKTYVEGICNNKSIRVDGELFTKALNSNRLKNSKVVIYPFDGQTDIPPAFYDELPDPLPEYSVSGFPISISFNEAFFKDIKLLEFKLFKGEKEITKTKIYSKESDPNRRLKNGEFALFPLKRLDWNSRYKVVVKYLSNRKIYKKVWHFKTKNFKDKFYCVTKNSKFTVTQGVPSIFYFPPTSKTDIFGDLKYPSFLDIEFIDKNTIKLIANRSSKEFISLKLGNKRLNLKIEKINFN